MVSLCLCDATLIVTLKNTTRACLTSCLRVNRQFGQVSTSVRLRRFITSVWTRHLVCKVVVIEIEAVEVQACAFEALDLAVFGHFRLQLLAPLVSVAEEWVQPRSFLVLGRS